VTTVPSGWPGSSRRPALLFLGLLAGVGLLSLVVGVVQGSTLGIVAGAVGLTVAPLAWLDLNRRGRLSATGQLVKPAWWWLLITMACYLAPVLALRGHAFPIRLAVGLDCSTAVQLVFGPVVRRFDPPPAGRTDS
jgi:hypothetical protein